MERSTNTFDVEAAAANAGTKTGADSANEGTKTGAEERNEGTNSAAAGLNENSGASTLRDKKGFDDSEGLLEVKGETSIAAGAERVRIRGDIGMSTTSPCMGWECSPSRILAQAYKRI
jgi:hypothetical protein